MQDLNVSMEQIQQILAGSRRLNEMKREIDATIGITRGLLTKIDVSRFRFGEIICEFRTPGLSWKITMLKRGFINIEVFDTVNSREPVYAWYGHAQADQLGRKHTQLIHQALPELLTNLVRIFPSLAAGFASLQQVVSQ